MTAAPLVVSHEGQCCAGCCVEDVGLHNVDRETAETVASSAAGLVAAEQARNLPRVTKPPMVMRSIRVPEQLWEAAKAKADEREENISDVIREALEWYARGDISPEIVAAIFRRLDALAAECEANPDRIVPNWATAGDIRRALRPERYGSD